MTNKKIARTQKGRKRPTKTRGEQPVDAEIRRAAQRMGIAERPASGAESAGAIEAPRERAARGLVTAVAEQIVRASDLMAEQLAQLVSDKDYERLHSFGEVHYLLWQVRWELGLTGEGLKLPKSDIDYAAKVAERGAS